MHFDLYCFLLNMLIEYKGFKLTKEIMYILFLLYLVATPILSTISVRLQRNNNRVNTGEFTESWKNS